MNHRLLLTLCTAFLTVLGCTPPVTSASHPALQVGDLLFQDLDCGSICNAIEGVTTGIDGARLSHVAMVSRVEQAQVWVIEAYAQGVKEVALDELLRRSKDGAGRPKVLIGRMLPSFEPDAARALALMKSWIGLPYDEAFELHNRKFYCSELIFEAFEVSKAQPFHVAPMTFMEPGQSVTNPVWQTYFTKLNLAVPEGKPGINPGAMSRSPNVRIVGSFGCPDGWNACQPSVRSPGTAP